MPSRGTMGMRMSRLLVDGLLNDTTYCRGFPSDTSKYLDGISIAVTEIVYTIKRQAPAVPAKYLYPSYFRVKFKTQVDLGTMTIFSQVYLNGVAVTGTESSHNNVAWVPIQWDVYGVQDGDLLQVYCKMGGGAQTGHIKDFSVCCSNEGVVEVVGAGAW